MSFYFHIKQKPLENLSIFLSMRNLKISSRDFPGHPLTAKIFPQTRKTPIFHPPSRASKKAFYSFKRKVNNAQVEFQLVDSDNVKEMIIHLKRGRYMGAVRPRISR